MAQNYLIFNLFDEANAQSLQVRLATLEETQSAEWGTMNATQMLAHCSLTLESSLDHSMTVPKKLAMKWAGLAFKKFFINSKRPFRKFMPTKEELMPFSHQSFEEEKQRLSGLMKRFAISESLFNNKVHDMVGIMTQKEWNSLVYKHLDHHFRQFGI